MIVSLTMCVITYNSNFSQTFFICARADSPHKTLRKLSLLLLTSAMALKIIINEKPLYRV